MLAHHRDVSFKIAALGTPRLSNREPCQAFAVVGVDQSAAPSASEPRFIGSNFTGALAFNLEVCPLIPNVDGALATETASREHAGKVPPGRSGPNGASENWVFNPEPPTYSLRGARFPYGLRARRVLTASTSQQPIAPDESTAGTQWPSRSEAAVAALKATRFAATS